MLQQSLEAALLDNPDDLATHSAYADYLMEQGDPRGEFIQTQLLLEDATQMLEVTGQPSHELARLLKRKNELLEQHGQQWLGDMGRFLFGEWSRKDKPYYHEFARGWLDLVRVLPAPDALIATLARAPETRLLRRLEIVYDMRFHPFDFDQFLQGPNQALKGGERPNEIYKGADIMPPLLGSSYLTNLRVFKLGFSDFDDRIGHSTMVMPFENCNAEQVIDLLAKCPRMEELYLNTALPGIERLFALPALGNIRILQYYYGTRYTPQGDTGAAYPLTALANNASLKQLTTLRLHAGRDETIELVEMDAVLRSPHLPSLTHLQVHMTNFGDEGCDRIIQSGILRRLKVLDIGYGNMTDEGAHLLAVCPDLKNLEELNVSRNALTAQGIAALKNTGVPVVADNQHNAGEEDYLYEVDFE